MIQPSAGDMMTHLEVVGHQHRQHNGLLQQSLGIVQISNVAPAHLGIFLEYITF